LGLRLTVGLGVAAIATWAFGWLLEEVLDAQSLGRWDDMAIEWMHARQTPLGDRLFQIVTLLGLPGVVIVSLVVALYLYRRQARLLLTGWIAANAGGGVLDQVLKVSVHRARPPFASAFFHGQSSSFPSGHAMSATICYVLLAYVITRLAPLPRSRQAVLYAAGAGLALLIGFSRLYLAVHYPSDVLGGHLAGAAWLAVCITGVEIGRAEARERARSISSAYEPRGVEPPPGVSAHPRSPR
jgi:membrane-associated phospholipid phosphatase